MTIAEAEAKLAADAATAQTNTTETTDTVGTNTETSATTEPVAVVETSVEAQQEANINAAVEAAALADNEATIEAPAFFKQKAATEADIAPLVAQSVTDWKETIKTVERKDLLKAAGVSDFAIEMDEHIRNGGDPSDYLNAKGFNWDSVSDMDIIKSDMKKQFPSFSAAEIDRLIAKKYTLTGEEEEDADGLLLMKAEAHTKREQQKAEQSKFRIPEAPKPVEVQQAATEQETAQARQQTIQQTVQHLKQNEPSTQALMATKKVTVPLGNTSYNFNVNPDFVTDAIVNPETWQRLVSTNPQEADVSKLVTNIPLLQKLVTMASNPNYEKDLFNYGKSQGLKEKVMEGQNAQRQPTQQTTASNASLAETFSTSGTKGTIGGLLQKLG